MSIFIPDEYLALSFHSSSVKIKQPRVIKPENSEIGRRLSKSSNAINKFNKHETQQLCIGNRPTSDFNNLGIKCQTKLIPL